MKRFLSLLILLFLLCSCSSAANCSAQDASCTRVLFIGNSYTFVNDLPNTFAKLAQSGGHKKVEVGMAAQGGWALSNHLESSETLNQLNSTKWNYVVLQEQSEIPSVEQSRTQAMYPAARELVRRIQERGATPIFFDTWAHRDGAPEYGMNTYQSMQAEIDTGYMGIAQELNVPIAPVGFAWFTAVQGHPELGLWQADGSHPTMQGTYLAACVFYAVIFHESPVGLTYRADLPKETAKILQTIASTTVLNTP